jgi:phage baseplate assembly protein W
MSIDFYGSGIAYPMQSSTGGGIRESKGIQKIEESIRIILGTQYGERLMRPGFGSNLKSLVFAPNNAATANLARYYVEAGLRQWEPRIEVFEVLVENDNLNGRLLIEIHYRLRATQDVHTLIFPFFLEAP